MDAPSNKTYGNCLLGLHCSQALSAETRANPCFFVVAGHQQEKSSTAYPQSAVEGLGTLSSVPTPFQEVSESSPNRIEL
jgi:hypothetical protein